MGAADSILSSVGARKRMSHMNGDFLFMLRDLKKTEIGPTMAHRNRFFKETCDKQVVIWQKEKDSIIRDIEKTQKSVKKQYHVIQTDKERIKKSKGKDVTPDKPNEKDDNEIYEEKKKNLAMVSVSIYIKRDN